MPYYVYILQSERDGRYYIGQTSNLEQRLDDHNKGRSKYTRDLGPWVLRYSKSFQSRSESMVVEKKLKGLKSREDLIKYAINNLLFEH